MESLLNIWTGRICVGYLGEGLKLGKRLDSWNLFQIFGLVEYLLDILERGSHEERGWTCGIFF